MTQDHSSDYKKVGHSGDCSGISVIIPMAGANEPITKLLKDLESSAISRDIILSGSSAISDSAPASGHVRVVLSAEGGRANCMNAGASAAEKDWLWFLHADSKLPETLDGLLERIESDRGALWWFNLRFHDAPRLMAANALGVWFRSHYLGCPFGDQGFIVPRRLFWAMGGFSNHYPYGEDHVFTWQCRRAGIALRCTGLALGTSARRYSDHGWASTTRKHLGLWAKQALQEWHRT